MERPARDRRYADACRKMGIRCQDFSADSLHAPNHPSLMPRQPPAAKPAAQEPAEGDQVAYETAKELYAAARKARNEEDWKRCQVKATAAWGIYQARAPLAALLGECELRLGDSVNAARHLALSLESDELKPALREHSAKLLDQAKQQVAVLGVTVDGAELGEPGVTLLVDGKPAEGSPLFLSPGSHTLEARHPDRGTATQTLKLEAGTEGKLNVKLSTVPGESSNGGGGNGETANGGMPYWPGFVAGGVGLVGIGVGVGLMVAAGGKRTDARAEADSIVASDNNCVTPSPALSTRCDDLADLTASIDSLETGALVGFIAGGATFLGGVGYLLFAATGNDQAEQQDNARIRFGASIGDGATLTINGTF